MSKSPAGSESVPKVDIPEEEVPFVLGAAKAEPASGDGAFKPEEEEAAAGGGDAAANVAAKRPKPEEEEEEATNSTAKRPKPEAAAAAAAAAVGDGPKPEEAAAGSDGPKPEAAAAGSDGPKPEEMTSDEEFERDFQEEMDRVRLYKKLLTGPRVKRSGTIKKVRVDEAAIKRLLEVRPAKMAMPDLSLPEDFHLAPADLRAQCRKNIEKAREGFEYEQYIIDQYLKKGYAEVHAYVFDE